VIGEPGRAKSKERSAKSDSLAIQRELNRLAVQKINRVSDDHKDLIIPMINCNMVEIQTFVLGTSYFELTRREKR
jgi:hypothetical protein